MQLALYRIVNKADGKVLFTNTNIACFAEITSFGFPDKVKGFAEGRYMEVFFPVINAKIDEDLIRWWLRRLSLIGFPCKLSKRDIKVEDCGEEPGLIYSKYTRFGDNYVITFDFDKYSSKAQLKLGLHLMRCYNEAENHTIITACHKYIQDNPKASFFEVVQFSHINLPKVTLSGHVVFSRSPRKIVSLKDLRDRFTKWKNQSYNDMEIYNFNSSRELKNPKNIPLITTLRNITDLKEYKKLTAKIENGKI